MKRIAGNVLLAISVILGFFFITYSVGTEQYNDIVIDRKSYEEIVSSRNELSDLQIEILFDEETLFFDKSNRLYFYSLVEESPTAFNPHVRLLANARFRIAFLEETITEQIIKNNVTISFIVYTDDYYCRYGLKCTTLPLLSISCLGEIGGADSYMSIMAFDNQKGAACRAIRSDGVIRIRGGSTSSYPKKGYRFALLADSVGNNVRANHISLFGMRQDDDWLLYAAYNDQEKIRNVFSSNLWEYSCATDNALKVNTGMEYKFIELFINGSYWGLYALGYPIDEKQLEMDGNTDRNALYKKSSWESEEMITYTGGYELKTAENGKANKNSAWELLYRYYYELAKNVKKTDMLWHGIDPDNAIDFMLFCNLIQGCDNVSDNFIKNQYLALWKDRKAIRALYCPWDLDLTWGNTWTQNPNPTYADGASAEYNRIMRSGYLNQIIVNNDSNVLDIMLDKYWRLRAGVWSEETLLSMLDLYESQIYKSGAYLRDMERWPDGSYADPDDGLHTFKEYVVKRLEETDSYYNRLEQLCDKSLYIKRSAQYANFLDRVFLIEINNKQMIEERNYADLLEYLGIEIERITEEVRYVLAAPSAGMYDYLSTIGGEGDVVKTAIGEIASYKEEGVAYADPSYYTVHLNGTACYVTNGEEKSAMRFLFTDETGIQSLFFKTDFTCSPQINTFRDLKLYLETLTLVDSIAVIEIGSPDFWQDNSYVALFAELGVINITKDTRAIIYNFMQQSGIVVNSIDNSPITVETDFGELTYSKDENNGLVIYMDGRKLPMRGISWIYSNVVSCVVLSDNFESPLDEVTWQFVMDNTWEEPKVKIVGCLRPVQSVALGGH